MTTENQRESELSLKKTRKKFTKESIPLELLDPNKSSELLQFFKNNHESLDCHSSEKHADNHYEVSIPLSDEWDDEQELIIIDKRNGKVVKVLEPMRSFELCEGISLKINPKELQQWEKETADVRKLNKEQNETLKSTLKKFGHERTLTRAEIVKVITEVLNTKQKPKKYRQSGHLVDQKLKYQQTENQLSLFEALMPETQQKIEESSLEVKAEGIRLSYAENKLVHALNLLLFEKSQNADPKAENFYAGNAPPELVPYGDQKVNAPVLKFKPAELYKAFMGNDNYSGADVKFIISTLHQLESKKVLIKYDRIKIVKDGNKTQRLTDRIEDFQSLIKVISFISNLRDDEKAALDKGDGSIRKNREELIIALNPIFRDQIDTKFIEFPEDSQRRMVIAAGGHKKVTASMQILMEYMLREISAKRYKPEINEEKLPFILGLEKYVKEKRKKLLQNRIEKDVQAIINMGIILGFEKKSNSSGGMKWVFDLNKDYD